MVEPPLLSAWMPQVITIARRAAQALLPFYQRLTDQQITRKKDNSPVTEADFAAHQVVVDGLSQLTPSIPILSEEGSYPDFPERKKWQRYWLTDPLDGTRGFIQHSNEFTVNIALIEKGVPILGVIVQPVGDHCYYAMQGQPAFYQQAQKQPVLIQSSKKQSPLRVVCGQYDRSAHFVKHAAISLGDMVFHRMNSSIKFCYLAAGQGDLYCRFGPTSEWDTAAGQCILVAAGGAVVDFNGQPLQYNAKSSLINPHFLAVGDVTQLNFYLSVLKKLRSNT